MSMERHWTADCPRGLRHNRQWVLLVKPMVDLGRNPCNYQKFEPTINEYYPAKLWKMSRVAVMRHCISGKVQLQCACNKPVLSCKWSEYTIYNFKSIYSRPSQDGHPSGQAKVAVLWGGRVKAHLDSGKLSREFLTITSSPKSTQTELEFPGVNSEPSLNLLLKEWSIYWNEAWKPRIPSLISSVWICIYRGTVRICDDALGLSGFVNFF